MNNRNKKLEKFLARLNELVNVLGRCHLDYLIQSRVNQFYYMQKMEELTTMNEKINELKERLSALEERYSSTYKVLYYDWVRDVRWLKTHLTEHPEKTKKHISIL